MWTNHHKCLMQFECDFNFRIIKNTPSEFIIVCHTVFASIDRIFVQRFIYIYDHYSYNIAPGSVSRMCLFITWFVATILCCAYQFTDEPSPGTQWTSFFFPSKYEHTIIFNGIQSTDLDINELCMWPVINWHTLGRYVRVCVCVRIFSSLFAISFLTIFIVLITYTVCDFNRWCANEQKHWDSWLIDMNQKIHHI